MNKIKEYAFKTILAMKNPFKSVDSVFPLALENISENESYYIGIKDTIFLTSLMEKKLKEASYFVHTRDKSSIGGRAIDINLKNPITGFPMTGSSSGTAINVFLGINDIGIGTDGGGSVLAPAISLNLFSLIDPVLFLEERKQVEKKLSTDGISFTPSIGFLSRTLDQLQNLYFKTRLINSLDNNVKVFCESAIKEEFLKNINLNNVSFKEIRGKYTNKRVDLIETVEHYLKEYDIIISKEGPIDLYGFGDSVFGHFDSTTKEIQNNGNKGLIRIANMLGCFALTIPCSNLSTGYLIMCKAANISAIKKAFLIGQSLKNEEDNLTKSYFLNYKNYF